ncbi:MAG: hypothetical protein JXR48_02630 [Candidatus Delongbacteria bacterium]|nr:hypothetical protein [Candidatus Delongbacteria bacterium]
MKKTIFITITLFVTLLILSGCENQAEPDVSVNIETDATIEKADTVSLPEYYEVSFEDYNDQGVYKECFSIKTSYTNGSISIDGWDDDTDIVYDDGYLRFISKLQHYEDFFPPRELFDIVVTFKDESGNEVEFVTIKNILIVGGGVDKNELAEIENAKEAKYLDISFNGDISMIEDFTNLLWLSTFDGDGDLSSLADLKNLRYLYILGYDGKGDISVIGELSDLEYCTLYSSDKIKGNINAFSELSKLKYLAIGLDNVEGDISAFSNLTSLVRLSISSHEKFTGNFSSISGLTNLEYLSAPLDTLDTSDLSAFSEMTKLKHLELSAYGDSAKLEGNTESLSSLTNLEYLDLGYNEDIRCDISSLLVLEKLEYLNLYYGDRGGSTVHIDITSLEEARGN